MAVPHPEFNGHIFFVNGDSRIWWIDGGLARWIVDETTYHGVFGGSPKKVEDSKLSDISVGSNVADGTVLIRAGNSAAIYLVDQNVKRLIPSEALKAKYQLNGTVQSVPQAVVNAVPNGASFS